MWPASYSALASRPCAGRYQEASTMVRPGVPSRLCSQSASITKGLVSAMVPPAAAACSASCTFTVPQKGPCSESRLLQGQRAEAYPEAPVLAALFLDLADMDLADLAGALHMRAAAGLAVDHRVVADANQPDATRAGGRADVL